MVTENQEDYFCSQLAACHYNKHRFVGQESPELCSALIVFMATSKDLKISDCHTELQRKAGRGDKPRDASEKALKSVIRMRLVTRSPRSLTEGICRLLWYQRQILRSPVNNGRERDKHSLPKQIHQHMLAKAGLCMGIVACFHLQNSEARFGM